MPWFQRAEHTTALKFQVKYTLWNFTLNSHLWKHWLQISCTKAYQPHIWSHQNGQHLMTNFVISPPLTVTLRAAGKGSKQNSTLSGQRDLWIGNKLCYWRVSAPFVFLSCHLFLQSLRIHFPVSKYFCLEIFCHVPPVGRGKWLRFANPLSLD